MKERQRLLLDELELAIRWSKPCIALAVYRSEIVRRKVLATLQHSLTNLGQTVLEMNLCREFYDFPLFVRDFPEQMKKVFSIGGFRWVGGRGYSNAYRALNMHREYLVETNSHCIFWLTQTESRQLARRAPDFWAFRHLVIDFSDLPAGRKNPASDLSLQLNSPRMHRTPDGMADLYFQLGCYEEAVVLYQKALRDDPNQGSLYLSLADVYLRMHRFSSALKILKKMRTSINTHELDRVDNLIRLMEQKINKQQRIEIKSPPKAGNSLRMKSFG